MKAILRTFGGDAYVVKDIELDANNTYKCDGKQIKETNILAIIDKKANVIKCSACGELVPNTKKDIAAHIKRKESYDGCLNCPSVRHVDTKSAKVKYVKNEDGTFSRSLKDNVTLVCNRAYFHEINITSEERLRYCQYAKCTKETLTTDDTIFGKFPNAFDDMITVDAIKFKTIDEHNGYTNLRLKCRGIVFACANKKGIIDHFEVRTRYQYYTIYYSKKYNELFHDNCGRYEVWESNWNITSEKIDYIKKTIANLYALWR